MQRSERHWLDLRIYKSTIDGQCIKTQTWEMQFKCLTGTMDQKVFIKFYCLASSLSSTSQTCKKADMSVVFSKPAWSPWFRSSLHQWTRYCINVLIHLPASALRPCQSSCHTAGRVIFPRHNSDHPIPCLRSFTGCQLPTGRSLPSKFSRQGLVWAGPCLL